MNKFARRIRTAHGRGPTFHQGQKYAALSMGEPAPPGAARTHCCSRPTATQHRLPPQRIILKPSSGTELALSGPGRTDNWRAPSEWRTQTYGSPRWSRPTGTASKHCYADNKVALGFVRGASTRLKRHPDAAALRNEDYASTENPRHHAAGAVKTDPLKRDEPHFIPLAPHSLLQHPHLPFPARLYRG